VLTLRPRPWAVLAGARTTVDHPPAGWLEEPPPGLHRMRASTELPGSGSLEAVGGALLGWDVHRRAGVRVAADGPARPGGSVVVGLGLGPLWALAPCRVVGLVDGPDAVGFTYATLPGHPATGVERFVVRRTAAGLSFDVEAVSRPALPGWRVLAPGAALVQRLVTARYLAAARRIALTA
jgi:uncharacterized protein (UPF0548 family)